MFIRKRVRDNGSGPRLYFTALRSVRTPAGPRQQTVASWYSPADPAHPFYAPSVEVALALIEVGVERWLSGLDERRDLARYHRGQADAVTAAGPHKYERQVAYAKRCAEAQQRACRLEARLREQEQQAEGLRAVLAEIGNWTWDGQL